MQLLFVEVGVTDTVVSVTDVAAVDNVDVFLVKQRDVFYNPNHDCV